MAIGKSLKGFKLYGFLVIYDHVNLLIEPGDEFNISQVMKSLKENISRNINIIMGYTLKQDSPIFVGHTTSCDLQISGNLRKKIMKLYGYYVRNDNFDFQQFSKIDIDNYSHSYYFRALFNYIKETYSIEIDKSCRDVARASFLCYDPDAFIHPKHLVG